MEKTKLGISVGLFAAIIYFIGATNNILIVAIMAGYILICESDEWLKKMSIKALILTVFFAVFVILINYLTSFLSAFGGTINNIAGYGVMFNIINFLFYTLPSLIRTIISVIQIILFIMFGFKAYKKQDIKIKIIDDMLDKNFNDKQE